MFKLKDSERLDDLQCNGLKIIQDESLYCFTADSVLISNFMSVKTNEIIVDFGTGCGVIPILVASKSKAKKVYGIELQKELFELAVRNVKINNLESRIEIINENIKNVSQRFKDKVDIVITNPPYVKKGNLTNGNTVCAVAKHELEITLEEITVTASKILKFGGKFYMVHMAKRLSEILNLLVKNKLEPKEIQFTFAREDKDANLVLIKAVSGGKPGCKVLKPLIMNNENGSFTSQVRNIYNKKDLS